MKHLIAILYAVVLAIVPMSGFADVTAEFNFKVLVHPKGVADLLHVDVRMHGIAKGETFKYGFRWTSPSEVFQDSTYIVESVAGDAECLKSSNPDCNCYCADTKEKGCWRTRAFRTIEWTDAKGKKYRARGTWLLELFRIDRDTEGNKHETTIGRSEYVVE